MSEGAGVGVCACELYEAGKQHRENGDWGEAKKHFEAAKKTKVLPDTLETKVDGYLEEHDKIFITEGSGLPAVSIGNWLSSLGPKYAEYAKGFDDYGYKDSNDLAAWQLLMLKTWKAPGMSLA